MAASEKRLKPLWVSAALFAFGVVVLAYAELVEFDGEDDHVHLLVNYPPTVSVSILVNSLKGVSSRMIRKKNYPSEPLAKPSDDVRASLTIG